MVAELWRACLAKGYKESWRTVYRLLAPSGVHPTPCRGMAEQAQAVPEAPRPDFCAKDAVWLFVRAPSGLEQTEKQDLALMCQASTVDNMLYELVQDLQYWANMYFTPCEIISDRWRRGSMRYHTSKFVNIPTVAALQQRLEALFRESEEK